MLCLFQITETYTTAFALWRTFRNGGISIVLNCVDNKKFKYVTEKSEINDLQFAYKWRKSPLKLTQDGKEE